MENGHVRIPNEIMDALIAIRLPGGHAAQMVFFIIRKTLGWNKKKDKISLSQIQSATGIPKHKIIEIRKKLVDMNIIAVTLKGNEKTPTYGFNEHYKLWKPLPKKVTITQKSNPVTQEGKKPLPCKVHTKDISLKDTSLKDTSLKDNNPPISPQGEKFDKFIKIYPKQVALKKAKIAWMQLFEHGYATKRAITKFIGPLTDELFKTLISGLKKQIKAKDRKVAHDQWVSEWPHPATWLRDFRWMDKIAPDQTRPLTQEEKVDKALME